VINRKILCKSGPLRRSPVLTGGVICVPPTVACSVLAVGDSTLTAVGRSRLLARWPGTHSRIVSWIQQAAQTVLGVYLKRTCLRVTSASSALGVLSDCALYKPTHSLTHSLQPVVGGGVCNAPGQSSLAPLRGRLIEYQLRLGQGRECRLCRVAGNTV